MSYGTGREQHMKNDPIRTKVLSIRLIPNADRFLLKAMQVQEGHQKSWPDYNGL